MQASAAEAAALTRPLDRPINTHARRSERFVFARMAVTASRRKRIEQGFGWVKTIGDLRKLPLVGLDAVRGWTTWTFAAYNLIRLGAIGAWWDPSST